MIYSKYFDWPRNVKYSRGFTCVGENLQRLESSCSCFNDTKTAVKQLNKLISGILVVVIIIVWLLLLEIATTKVLLVLSSQLLLAGFIFKNIWKTIFEAIIFVYVMHPFDVGDRCVIDGTQVTYKPYFIFLLISELLDQLCLLTSCKFGRW